MRVIAYVLLAVLVLVGGALALFGDFSSDDPGFETAPGQFEGRFLAVSDTDMAATAYADGALEPLDGVSDQIVLFEAGAAVAEAAASNSVISWPQVVDVDTAGARAFVVETRTAAPSGVSQMDSVYENFPNGSRLSLIAIEDGALRLERIIHGIGLNPQSVDVFEHGGETYLAIASEADGAELVIVRLTEFEASAGEGGVSRFDLDPPFADDDTERRVRNLHVAPSGDRIAVNVANRRVQFYELVFEGGDISGVRAEGDAVDVGVRLAVGRWTPDGHFFLITDVNSYESTFAMLTQRGGQVHVLAPPAGAAPPSLIDSARVGRFAEGFEISDDGRYVASIAMERTYLPELPFLDVWPRRRRYSLHLLSLDPQTGEMDVMDEIRIAGVLPEDVIFDEGGEHLAVAVFHRRKGEDRQRGFIDFFSITPDGQLVAQGVTQPVPRGAHDLVRLP